MDAWLNANAMTLLVIVAAVAGVLLLAVIVLLALWLRSRRVVRLVARERSAAERARIDLELTLAEEGSRMRMIREMHEVAVHTASRVISEADGARFAATQDPSAAGRAAAAIAETARALLADLRRVLTLVRDGEEEAAAQPGLANVSELFAAMGDAGLTVEFEQNGAPHELRHGAEIAIYRILQEALGNALTHGGDGTRAKVVLTWTDDGLQLLIEDDGTRATAIREGRDPYVEAQQHSYTVEDDLAALTQAPAGRGIGEMRERTELFGGVFEAHRVPGVGFTVQAVFPSLRYHNGVHGVRLEPR
ncbi:sensor histidine kinase [Homoserinibacter sp. GY 40078]|uniref:sensor histidine kinase n=1 Tax=Homoserinibacter sp. GY 40078 TaxID=2603275 RepID=UPI0011C70E0C|nr:ATP-binding protein [Homoserinibacter sp. GY 40078]TXK17373.1 ATP-binding protein [Homoserinibacter sp. GY 40078]